MYYDEIIKNYDSFRSSKRFGALNTKFLGPNLVVIPFVPLYLKGVVNKKLNEYLLNVQYFPIAVFSLILFILGNLALIPVVYFTVMVLIPTSESRDPTKKKILYFIMWVLVGPFILFINIFRDSKIFWMNLYSACDTNANKR